MTILENTDAYRLDSYGNGAVYSMTDKRTGETRATQFGDDAIVFGVEYESMQRAHSDPLSVWHRETWNACLNYLFSECLA